MNHLKDILRKIITSSPDYKDVSKKQELKDKWELALGNAIHQNSSPLALFDDGVLLIGTYHSGWSQQLKLLEPQILKKLKTHFPHLKILKLKFRVIEKKEIF